MSDVIKHIEISFNAEWFQSCYSVYVLTIKKADDVYYYIGQTGDRKHISARSPFYRLMGHYSPYQGTDTQLVQGLIKHKLVNKEEGKPLRVCLEEAFYNKHIEVNADYFKVDDFDGENHVPKRELVEEVEKLLIDYYNKKGSKIFNAPQQGNAKITEPSVDAVRISSEIIKLLESK